LTLAAASCSIQAGAGLEGLEERGLLPHGDRADALPVLR
jgi:hypothetical protein